MTPQDAARLVGHSPQTRDIVERLRARRESVIRASEVVGIGDTLCWCAADEIERLRTALRAVRASTDPKWQAQIISDALRESEI